MSGFRDQLAEANDGRSHSLGIGKAESPRPPARNSWDGLEEVGRTDNSVIFDLGMGKKLYVLIEYVDKKASK